MADRKIVCPQCGSDRVTALYQVDKPIIADMVGPNDPVHIYNFYRFRCEGGHQFDADVNSTAPGGGRS